MPDKNKRTHEVTILTDYCKGCALCVEYCPAGVLMISEKPNHLGIQQAVVQDEERCKGCLQCVLMCPDAAIEIIRVCGESRSRQRKVSY